MSKKTKSFVEQCLAGDIDPSQIDVFVEDWHGEKGQGTLAQHLGFSEEEYACWVEEPSTLRSILFSRETGIPLNESLRRATAQGVAARCGNASEEGEELREWLERTGRI
jgi:hypothetical protein